MRSALPGDDEHDAELCSTLHANPMRPTHSPTPTPQNLYTIAYRLRGLILCIAAYLIAQVGYVVAAMSGTLETAPWLILVLGGIGLIALIGTLFDVPRLVLATGWGAGAAVLCVVGLFLPIISLIVLLSVNNRAVAILKRAGLHVGLTGVPRPELHALRDLAEGRAADIAIATADAPVGDGPVFSDDLATVRRLGWGHNALRWIVLLGAAFYLTAIAIAVLVQDRKVDPNVQNLLVTLFWVVTLTLWIGRLITVPGALIAARRSTLLAVLCGALQFVPLVGFVLAAGVSLIIGTQVKDNGLPSGLFGTPPRLLRQLSGEGDPS